MSTRFAKIFGWTLLCVVGIAACVVAAFMGWWFYAGIPRPLPEHEVIGHWQAEPGKTGEGDFYADGTFRLTGLSMDIFTGEDAVGTFSGYGTWITYDDSADIGLSFERAEDIGNAESRKNGVWMDSLTLGWGDHRQLYFSDGEELNQFKMNRVSDVPLDKNTDQTIVWTETVRKPR